MMEHNFKPSSLLYLQIIHEMMELFCKQSEESMILDELGSYENEVVGWIDEVEKFMAETKREMSDESLEKNSFWYNKMISIIREVRAKRGPKSTFRRVSNINVGSLREELYCKLRLLINIKWAEKLTNEFHLTGGQNREFNKYNGGRWDSNEHEFLKQIKVQLEEKSPEKNSDWYRNKIAKTRLYIGQHDSASYPHSQDVGSFSMALHDELYCEVRLLISVKMANLMTLHAISSDHHDLNQFRKVLRNRIRKVNMFLTKINQQLKVESSEKNSDWYCNKVEETKTLIHVLSQDLGSTLSMFTTETKLFADAYAKIWSLQHLELPKGRSILTMEQDSNTSLFLQVFRELAELVLKSTSEDVRVISFWSHPNESFDEVLEWAKEAEEFTYEAKQQLSDITLVRNPIWCMDMISEIRKLRVKRGPNFTFQIVRDDNFMPMSIMTPREKFFCELSSLSHIRLPLKRSDQDYVKFNEYLKEWEADVDDFFSGVDKHFKFEFDPETNSGWYTQKIAEARMLIAKCEPAFSLLSQHHVRSAAFSLNISLHEELCYEIRLLIRFKCIDLMTASDMPIDDHDLAHEFKKQLQKWINEVNKFLTEINLQIGEKNLDKSSDWYHNKIAGSRMLIDKRYAVFPFQSQQDVGYMKKQYQIFLSFQGKDTQFSFTRNLYNALHQAGFKIFMYDQGLERGDSISQALMGVIENSKLSIIVFSINFANSTSCLDEVVKILDCKKKENQLVWPVFYKVEPSEVRYLTKNYGEAMARHETRFRDEKVTNWRSALHEVSGFNAFTYEKNMYESDFIDSIVKAACKIRDGSFEHGYGD